MSCFILLTLIFGIGCGMGLGEGITAYLEQSSSIMLLILLFSVGIDLGRNRRVFGQVKAFGFRILLIPVGVVLGSLIGGVVSAILLRMPLREGMAISSGLGWYSLSGILITEAGNPIGGTISFLCNVIREMMTFVMVPFLASNLHPFCAIAPAGATAMDTTLGIISKHTNAETAILAFASGIICTMLVPILVPLFL